MRNQEIRDAIRIANLRQWEVAKRLEIGEVTLIRWLRDDLSAERREAILQAIADLQKEGRST